MSRLVEAVPSGTKNTLKVAVEQYLVRIAKYVPAEVIAFYTASITAISVDPGPTFRVVASAIVFLLGLGLTWWWLGHISTEDATKLSNQRIGTVAFAIWAYAYPKGLHVEVGWYNATAAALLMAFFTLWSGTRQPEKP